MVIGSNPVVPTKKKGINMKHGFRYLSHMFHRNRLSGINLARFYNRYEGQKGRRKV